MITLSSIFDSLSLGLAALGTTIILLLILPLVLYIALLIAWWKLFEKAGEAGWKSLIPIYNLYIWFKITWSTKAFWYLMVAPFVALIVGLIGAKVSILLAASYLIGVSILVLNIIQAVKAAKAYGYPGSFALGLIFLPNIFYLIMGFGKNEYIGPQE